MASRVEVVNAIRIDDADGTKIMHSPEPKRFGPGVTPNGKRETVSLPGSTYTALTVPSGAKHLYIILGTAVSLTIKGASGDTGIPILPSSNPTGADLSTPLGASPTPGILNGSASTQTVEVIWG